MTAPHSIIRHSDASTSTTTPAADHTDIGSSAAASINRGWAGPPPPLPSTGGAKAPASVSWPWPPREDTGFRPVYCTPSGLLSTFQLWKVPGLADRNIDFDKDWLYISIDGQYCTLADTPSNTTEYGPPTKAALSCHLPGATGAQTFQFQRVAFPYAGLNSLGTRGPCGARDESAPSPHDLVCRRVALPDRQYVFTLILQKPGQDIVSGAVIGKCFRRSMLRSLPGCSVDLAFSLWVAASCAESGSRHWFPRPLCRQTISTAFNRRN